MLAWAVGDYCISLKVLKSPHKEIHSFKLTMLWLSLSCSLSSAKYGGGVHMATVVVCILHRWKYLAEDNEEERDNHSIVSLNEYIS